MILETLSFAELLALIDSPAYLKLTMTEKNELALLVYERKKEACEQVRNRKYVARRHEKIFETNDVVS